VARLRLGIAHHPGWAVAVTASADHHVVDRRRIELVEPGMATAPIEHDCEFLSDAAAAALVAKVRASVVRAASASLDQLATALPEPIVSMSLRSWPLDLSDDIAVQRTAVKPEISNRLQPESEDQSTNANRRPDLPPRIQDRLRVLWGSGDQVGWLPLPLTNAFATIAL
jgi:hypothetical protein